jgi:hypothetical protein
VHEDDVVAALGHATRADVPGIYNVAADGVLALTEVIDLLGKQWVPLLPPWGTGLAAAALRRLGLRIPPEMLGQLRFGRGLDNRKLKVSGFGFRYTTRETVVALAEYMRLHPVMRGGPEPYRYEREVEDFLRWSPNVKNPAYRTQPRLSPAEVDELSRLSTAHAERTGIPGGGSSLQQAESLARAARADEEDRVASSSLAARDGHARGRGRASRQPDPALRRPRGRGGRLPASLDGDRRSLRAPRPRAPRGGPPPHPRRHRWRASSPGGDPARLRLPPGRAGRRRFNLARRCTSRKRETAQSPDECSPAVPHSVVPR